MVELAMPTAKYYNPPTKEGDDMAKKKDPGAVRLGRKGGLARAKKLSKEELHRQAVFAGKQGGRPRKKKPVD